MFADPLVLTRGWTTITPDSSVDLSMPASERAADHSTYRATDADQNDHVLFIGHQYGRRSRFTARYTLSGVQPSLTIPDQNVSFSQSVYVVADVLSSGAVGATQTQSQLMRRQMKGIGGLLINTALLDVIFDRVLRGET